jgi:hypothetical protein
MLRLSRYRLCLLSAFFTVATAGLGVQAQAPPDPAQPSVADGPRPSYQLVFLGDVGPRSPAVALAMSHVGPGPSEGPSSDLPEIFGSCTTTEFATLHRAFSAATCTETGDTETMLAAGAGRWDGAVLVVSLEDGPTLHTREQIALARDLGVPTLAIYFDGADVVRDQELMELIAAEVRDLLGSDGMAEVPVIFGSSAVALAEGEEPIGRESIERLLLLVDAAPL